MDMPMRRVRALAMRVPRPLSLYRNNSAENRLPTMASRTSTTTILITVSDMLQYLAAPGKTQYKSMPAVRTG